MSTDKPTFVQRIRTTNDVNGNPRRLWIGYRSTGAVMSVVDEGYGGRPWPNAIELMPVDVGPGEYRTIKREFASILVRS